VSELGGVDCCQCYHLQLSLLESESQLGIVPVVPVARHEHLVLPEASTQAYRSSSSS
jgi:hypothetical protein